MSHHRSVKLKVSSSWHLFIFFYIRSIGPKNIVWGEDNEKVCKSVYWKFIFCMVLSYTT